jgi:hypothetical protein
MSIFQKRPPRVEIFIHHHSFSIRPPFLAGLPFCSCLLFNLLYILEHYGLDTKIADFSQKMGRNLANIFFIKQGWPFSGDVSNIRHYRNSIYVPKMGVLVLTFFLIFLALFLGIFCIFVLTCFIKYVLFCRLVVL